MNEENTTPDATTTPPATPEPDTDPATWDGPRAARTIAAQRTSETALKQEVKGLREAVQSLASGRPLTPAAQGLVDAGAAPSETDHYKQAFSDLSSALLGAEYDGNPDRLVAAAKAARVEGKLTAAILEAGGDLELTRLAVAPGLAHIDPSSPSLANDLSELVGHALLDHKALKRQSFGPVSGAPFPAGSGGSQAPNYISQEAISMASAEQIVLWRKSGLIPGYAGDRR